MAVGVVGVVGVWTSGVKRRDNNRMLIQGAMDENVGRPTGRGEELNWVNGSSLECHRRDAGQEVEPLAV